MADVYIIPDLHLKDGLSSRIDNYGDTALVKLGYIFSLIGVNDDVVFLGDVYDSVESISSDGSVRKRPVSYSLESRFRGLLKPYQGRVFSLVGNHDIIGDSLDTFPQTGLGLNPYIAAMGDYGLRGSSPLIFLDAYQDPLKKFSGLVLSDRQVVRNIALHGFVHETKHDPKTLWYSVEVLKGLFPNLSGVFAGHDHKPYPITDMLGVKVYRSGSLMRTDSGEYSYKPRGMYVLRGGVGNVDYVEIPSCPYNDVFLQKNTVKRVSQSNKKFIEETVSPEDSLKELKAVLDSVDDIAVRKRVITLLQANGVHF